MNIKLKKNCKFCCFCILIFTIGCRNIDCPLENTVLVGSKLYYSDTDVSNVSLDTLLVTALGTDSLMSCQKANLQMSFPLRYSLNNDTLLLSFMRNGQIHTTDTLYLEHTNTIHFENIDCPPAVFSELKTISWGNQQDGKVVVDSASISSPIVNYNGTENIKIFVHYNN